MKLFLWTTLLLALASCSYFKRDKEKIVDAVDFSKRAELTNDDYKVQLASLKKSYLNTQGINEIKINRRDTKYLEKITTEIQKQNELFFTTESRPEFTIVESDTPFHFSLPGKNIFISSGLINKYIKSEKLLYCLLIYELIRSEKGVYRKQFVIPTGFITSEKILSMMRLKIEDKVEIHKWAFYLLKRIGIDTDNYLSWLQIQNRNSVDFSMQLGDISVISREEALFKAFIIKNTTNKSAKFHEGSSKSFYRFVSSIKR